MSDQGQVVGLVGRAYATWDATGARHMRVATTPDGCVVRTAPLARIVRSYEQRERRKRPWNRGSLDPAVRNGIAPADPLETLASDAGLPIDVVQRVTHPRLYPRTELRVADALVGAVGNDSAFYDGTLSVSQNVRATPAQRRECCATGPFR